jgi:alpha-glucoside transport system substrate-binding protein
MYKQASFAQNWFPDSARLGDDLDVFVLPDADGGDDAPLLVGADTLVQFSDDPDVHRLMQYLVSADGGREWARRGGYLSGRTSVDLGTYYTPADERLAALLIDGRPLRFDGSDVMPPEVGSGLLWQELTTWVAGSTSTDALVATIDEALATS